MGKSKREEIYQKLSMLAAHPSKIGFDMLRPKGGDGAILGPFMDETELKALLEELGMLAPQAGLAFSMSMRDDTANAPLALHRFVLASMRYGVRYLGMRYTEADVAEVNHIFGSDEPAHQRSAQRGLPTGGALCELRALRRPIGERLCDPARSVPARGGLLDW